MPIDTGALRRWYRLWPSSSSRGLGVRRRRTWLAQRITIGRCFCLGALGVLVPGQALGQLAGDLSLGEYGLTAGTAPPVGLSLSVAAQEYFTNTLVGPQGVVLPTSGSLNTLAVPILSLWWVSPWTLLGGNFGVQLSLQGTSSRSDYPRLGSSEHGYGFGDTWIQPAGLSWHTTYVDALAGLALYIPTGRYQPGGDNNTGQGQWGFEFSGGATVWFDAGHHFNFAALALYDVYSPKSGTVGLNNTQLQTGNTFSLQGAFGYQFLDGALNIGIPYSFQWKVTQDTLPPGVLPAQILSSLAAAKAWNAALGLEVDYSWGTSDGVVLRWLQGFGGTNTTNGASIFFVYSHQFTFDGTPTPPAAQQ